MMTGPFHTILLGLLLALFSACVSGAAVAHADDPGANGPAAIQTQPTAQGAAESRSAEQIEHWIAELDSEQYLRREQATERLSGAGQAALRPLARVADGNNLEAASRALHVLLEMSESADPALALSALEHIAGLENRPADQAAAIAQLDDMRERKALAEIVRLGGVEQQSYVLSGREINRHLLIGSNWQGGDEDLKHLTHLRSFYRVSIHSAPISDQGLKHLHGLRLVGSNGIQPRLELYGTKVTAEATDAFQDAHREIEIDLRSAAKLGVAGDPQLNQAVITYVEAGSAAMEAGIHAGDVIVKFEDEPVEGFEQLTAMIAKRQPDETASLEIRRGDQTVVKTVKFKRWE